MFSCTQVGTDIQECDAEGKDDRQIERYTNHGMFSFAALSMQRGQGKALTTSEPGMTDQGEDVASMRCIEQ
jgi:hypothetical protein